MSKVRRYARGELTYEILVAVAKGALVTAAVIIALSGIGFRRRRRGPRAANGEGREREEDSRTYYATLARLKKQGMLSRRVGKWKVTKRGRSYLSERGEGIARGVHGYPKTRSATRVIVAFDVPERFGSRRATLREALRALDFSMLQKSVWIGWNTIPRELLDDLREWKIIRYVHVFEVARPGTVE